MPRELVKRTDALAKGTYKSRSELIREALISYLRKNERWVQIFVAGREAGLKAGISSEQQVYDIISEVRHGKKSSKSSSRQ